MWLSWCIHICWSTYNSSNTAAAGAAVNNTNKKVIFNNFVPITTCVTEMNSAQVDDAQDSDIVMSVNDLIECSDAYLKTSGNTIEMNQL